MLGPPRKTWRARYVRALSRATFTIVGLAACNEIAGTSDYSIAPSADAGNAEDPVVEEPDAARRPPSDQPVVDTSPNGVVSIVAVDGLDFGSLDCGETPPPRRVQIQNLGSVEFTFTAAMATAQAFSVTPPSGVVAGGGVVELSLATPGVPNDGPPGTRVDKLLVTTTAADDVPHALDVTFSAEGAIFVISPTTMDFGTTTSTKTRDFTISNTGNLAGGAAFIVKESYSNSFDISPSTPTLLSAGGVEVRKVLAHPPKNGAPQKTGSVTLSSKSPLCGPLPTLQLRAYHND